MVRSKSPLVEAPPVTLEAVVGEDRADVGLEEVEPPRHRGRVVGGERLRGRAAVVEAEGRGGREEECRQGQSRGDRAGVRSVPHHPGVSLGRRGRAGRLASLYQEGRPARRWGAVGLADHLSAGGFDNAENHLFAASTWSIVGGSP